MELYFMYIDTAVYYWLFSSVWLLYRCPILNCRDDQVRSNETFDVHRSKLIIIYNYIVKQHHGYDTHFIPHQTWLTWYNHRNYFYVMHIIFHRFFILQKGCYKQKQCVLLFFFSDRKIIYLPFCAYSKNLVNFFQSKWNN